jgi:hypothetical protein
VESTKIELALKSDFNVVDAFKMIDKRGHGSFTQQDLAEGLTQCLGFMEFSNDDIYLLFRRFDQRNEGLLNFNHFSRMCLPFSREYASLVTDRIDYYSRRTQDGARYFNADTRYELQAFFNVLLRTERAMEALRCRLNARQLFSFRDVFEYCARSQTGIILA